MSRPRLLISVVGTATEVGKTWATSQLAAALIELGHTVSARKPLQSNIAGEATDSAVLATATGEQPSVVCLPERSLDLPMAPPMAASELGVEIPNIEVLIGEVLGSWPARAVDVGFVETVGGPRSPVTDDADSLGLALGVEPDVVLLVTDASLGTINSTMLSLEAIAADERSSGLRVVVLANRFSAERLAELNVTHLRAKGVDVAVTVAELVERITALMIEYCGGCGLELDAEVGDHDNCRSALDPDRYCSTCGRKLKVKISPAGHSSRCVVHGSAMRGDAGTARS